MKQKPWNKKKAIRYRESAEIRLLKETFLIVCEGEKTEPAYFDSKIGRAEYIKKLKKHLGSYEKNDKTVYEKIIQKQSVAIRNAQRLISSCDMKNPNKCEPCTTVVNLVGALNRFL